MKKSKSALLGLFSLLTLVALVATSLSEAPDVAGQRAAARKTMQDGNFKDAYNVLRKLCLDKESDPKQTAEDVAFAVQCLNNLARTNEVDEFLESTVKAHSDHWLVLRSVAQQYLGAQHHGFIIAGKFERGHHRGGGRVAHATERDRLRALQLFVQAVPLAAKDDNKPEVSRFYVEFSNGFLNNRGIQEAWRLQVLSDLTQLPDYDEGWPQWQQYNGAPVDEAGNPIYYKTPESWEKAANDGERWRWCLVQAVENDPAQKYTVLWQFASYMEQMFGVQSMQWGGYMPFFGGPTSDDDTKKNDSGTYALHTLSDDETIAKLANGIKRFKLPDEFNFIKIYKQLAEDPKAGGYRENASDQLARNYENRRQYPSAAEWWKKSIAAFGAGPNNWRQQQLDQIAGNWGMFENTQPQPAREGAKLDFRFRNGKKVNFVAHAVKTDELLADIKAFLKSDPGNTPDFWQKVNLSQIGWRLVHQGETKYIGAEVAKWALDLEPREKHFDKRITVSTPLQKSGCYLVTAEMEGGNVSKILVWVADTAIAQKMLDGKTMYYVADAVDGTPVANANLEFFGYKQEHLGGNRWRTLTSNFAEQANADGIATPDPRDLKQDYQWLITARTKEGRNAFFGFVGAYNGRLYDQDYNAVKVFAITDRPVYRPDQKVQFKLWVRRAQYDQDATSEFAKQTFPVEIYNPKGEKIYSQTLETDEYAGMVGELPLAKDAPLGMYRINVNKQWNNIHIAGGNNFRVEEYKKPEFEVTVDAPSEPVMLGEKIDAKIKAKYYFGSPVVNAKVKYKITRVSHTQTWFPRMPWDWCYGQGYWWFAYDYPWYPGWNEWCGCKRPYPIWWWRGPQDPPEVVADMEVDVGPEGEVDVQIDSTLAKELHPNQDHEYTITAEVKDESRRIIVGSGKVLVARKPFKVFSWLHRGYYRVGDTISASFKAQTLDNKPVEGKGELTLLKIAYDKEGEPKETPVQTWKVDTTDEGLAEQKIKATAKGQYRLSYKLTDSKKHTIEGGYIFTIIGDGFDGENYKFDNVELIPDKREYAPGETVKMQVNVNRANATVLLFVRPTNGIYLPPKVLRLDGKSTVQDIAVVKKDMPNFFVEALTLADGKVYVDSKEVVVPPEKRILNVEVLPNETAYKPGQKAKVKVHLTDFTGENFVGSTVMTVYDKAVEYISGGSNVPDIKEFFWKWRRHHQPQTQHNLALYSPNLTLPNMPGMNFLGVFGATVVEELDSLEKAKDGKQVRRSNLRGEAKGFGGGMAEARKRDGGVEYERAALGAPAAPAAAKYAADANGLADRQSQQAGQDKAEAATPPPADVEPTVRTKFADTAHWVAALTTDKNGNAEVEFDMPENLSSWKIKVWGMGHGTKVGSGEADVVTRKNLILRLQAPRFFVQKDEVVLTANVHNYLDKEKLVTVVLDTPADILKPQSPASVKIKVPAGGEKRVDWRCTVLNEGEPYVRMKALTDEESDAMEIKLPSYVHGMLKQEAWAGTIRPDKEKGKVTINVPKERRVDQSVLEVRYSPTLAGAMVDALPYLADYPYDNTESTLNRFLPSVITQKVLLEMKLNLAAIRDKRSNLNAQEIGDDQERAKQWKRFDRNPVFDEEELGRMVKDGVKMLTDMQNKDGGWGWFSGTWEHSWPHTTAVVVHGLQVAKANDVAIVPGVLENGIAWLKRYQDEQVNLIKRAPAKAVPYKEFADNLDSLIYMILVDGDVDNVEMRDFLYRDRNHLAVYAKATLGLALEKQKQAEKLAMIMKNIEQYVVEDEENESAYLKLPADTYWWYWYGSETEANAYYLKLLARTDGKGERAPRLVKYLLNNRKHATYWNNTRDTALCVEAFSEFLRASSEMKPEMVVEVWIDGEKRQEAEVNSENLFTFNNKFVLKGADVKDGSHDVEIRRRGKGPVYFNAYLTNFTLEDPITKAGLEVKVQRKIYKLKPVDKKIKVQGSRGQAADQKVEKYEREELKNLDTLKSGDLVEVELEIDSKNDYEYILFEDMKAAGFEPTEVRSGYNGNDIGAYVEFRDNRVAFFVRTLARGKHSVKYRLRAEIPGQFAALPAKASATYAPELKGNSDEIKLKIVD